MNNQMGTTAEEKAEFEECDAIVKSDGPAVMRLGEALTRIREKKLYRCAGMTFKEYVWDRLQLKEAHAYRLLDAYEVKNSPIGEFLVNEGQARELVRVPAAARPAVMAEVSGSGKVVTAQAIKQAAKRIVEPQAPIEVDAVGKPIPAGLLDSWHRALEIAREGHRSVTALRSSFRTADESDDPVFNEVNISSILSSLGGVYTGFSKIKPHAVCHTCQGLRSSKCAACRGRGFVSKDFWDHCVPIEFKGAA